VQVYKVGLFQIGELLQQAVFGVRYDRAGRVITLIYNNAQLIFRESPSLTPGKGSPVRAWATVKCGGRAARVDRPLSAGQPTTIVWGSVPQATAIVTSNPKTACADTAAAVPAPCRFLLGCAAKGSRSSPATAPRALGRL
jgi:hypothetical protein